jgi:hypothetical protein
MNHALRIAPGEEQIEQIDNAIERAMNELDPALRVPQQEVEQIEEEARQNTALDLIKRSRSSFENNAASLQANIDQINVRIAEATAQRDDQIARIHDRHREYLHQAERQLYQITTVKAAIELALAGLSHDPEQ